MSIDGWLTPPHIIRAVEQAFGIPIGLDPCAEQRRDGQPYNVPAMMHYDGSGFEMNGLTRPWAGYGAVFVNPPYSRKGNPGAWVRKAVYEHRYGPKCGPWQPGCRVIMLLPAKTETVWMRPLAPYPRVFLWGRVQFLDPATRQPAGVGRFPSMVVGLGVSAADLYRGFGKLGNVYIPYEVKED